ncbi:MAG: hypothetical protein GY799_25380 [Desulfobulbaceae bacterium]|nr:hypothetical protein [Desulfobulbaceae bacterium]
MTLGVTTEEKDQFNFRTCGGGKLNQIQRVTAMTVSMTLTDWTEENLAKALYGTFSAVSVTPIVAEAHANAWHDGLVRFDNIPNPSVAPVIKGSGGTPTYTVTTDYLVTDSGIMAVSTGAIADGGPVECDYTPLAGFETQALMTSGLEFAMTFEGLNEAQSCESVVVDLYRVRFSPTDELGFIADEYGAITLTGEVLLDSTRLAANGQYMKVEHT